MSACYEQSQKAYEQRVVPNVRIETPTSPPLPSAPEKAPKINLWGHKRIKGIMEIKNTFLLHQMTCSFFSGFGLIFKK